MIKIVTSKELKKLIEQSKPTTYTPKHSLFEITLEQVYTETKHYILARCWDIAQDLFKDEFEGSGILGDIKPTTVEKIFSSNLNLIDRKKAVIYYKE